MKRKQLNTTKKIVFVVLGFIQDIIAPWETYARLDNPEQWKTNKRSVLYIIIGLPLGILIIMLMLSAVFSLF